MIDAGYLHKVVVYIWTAQFNDHNGLGIISRAHQLLMEGFNWWQVCMFISIAQGSIEGKKCGDSVAPNYCYWCGNFAAILEIREDQIFLQLDPAPLQTERPPILKSIQQHLLSIEKRIRQGFSNPTESFLLCPRETAGSLKGSQD
ncbi:hypothetical protein N665_4256s0003 [Sinapis alba]|nr:hypothetical protein N665_4256s0003 [Sinapis alba]